MLTTELPITERATSVLYHYTGVRAALDIVRNGEFQLSTVVGTPSEESYAPPGFPYFLSTTRSRVGDYHRYVGNAGVMFVLDGEYFNRHYKVRPIDYWERAWTDSPGRTRESEDRVFSREPTIPATGIRAIHVLLKSQDDTRGSDTRRLLITAKRAGIPIHLYQDEQSWRVQDVRRRLPIGQALELLQGKERSGVNWPRRNYLEQWVELIHKKATAELSEPARKLAFNLVYYNRGYGDDDMGLAQDLSNARKPGTDDHGTAVRLISHLKKYNYKITAMVKALHDKWADISKQEQTAKKESVSESQDIFEVKMSPGELRRWLDSGEAQGIQAGFEAELIFRNTNQEQTEESEPDYDADERARSIEGVVDFFQGGENGIGRNAANRLRDGLYEEFGEWREDLVQTAWENDEEDHVLSWMEENVWEEDQDLYRERAAEDLGIETSEESAERSEEIETRAREFFEQDVRTTIDEQDDDYDRARQDFRDDAVDNDSDYSEEAFFEDRYPYMTDVGDAYSLDWPYWTEGSSGGNGRTVDDIANDLSSALGGADVRASSSYHGVARRSGRWIVEPDGSLDPDDSDDAGLEIVSPPMPLPEAMAALRKVIDWANSDGDAYTNSSTGLHMGVSVPYKGGDVDYVKLILFMGDQYVLDQFDRAANSYTRSALEKLQDVQRRRRRTQEAVTGWDSKDSQSMTGAEKTAAAMDLIRKNLIELAQRYVQDGVGGDKYTSAHIRSGYIEFRSPGGDYLSMDNRDESALATTMLRFSRAMHIASRPDLERKEYSKKLYKLLSGFRAAELTKSRKDTRYRTQIETEGEDDALELFAKYSAGLISPEILKKEWAQRVLAKEQPRPQAGDKFEIYRTDTGEVLDVITGRDEGEIGVAVAQAVERFSGQGFDFKIRKQGEPETKEPSRRLKVAKRIQQTPTKTQTQQPATGGFPYRVTWSEGGREDSLNTTAASAKAAEDNLVHVLDAMGRRPDPGSVRAVPRPVPGYQQGLSQQDQPQATAGRSDWREYQIYDANTRDTVVGFMAASDEEALQRLERHRVRYPGRQFGVRTGGTTTPAASQSQGEWSGRWLIKTSDGQVIHTFAGIGNVQADANRYAARWLGTNRPELENLEIEVVPEMV